MSLVACNNKKILLLKMLTKLYVTSTEGCVDRFLKFQHGIKADGNA